MGGKNQKVIIEGYNLSEQASEESNRALDFNWIETFAESWTVGDQV